MLTLRYELTTNIDVTNLCTHREGRDQTTLNEVLRIMTHDVAVFAGARFGFVCVHDQIMWALFHLLRHERPFKAGREPSPTAPTQARLLDDIDNGVMT